MKNKYIKYIVILVLALFTFIPSTKALEENIVNIHLFYSKVCPHCAKEIKVINELEKKYNNLKVYKHETSTQEAYELLKKVENHFNIKVKTVPFTVIGEKYYSGYSEENTKKEFVEIIEVYSKTGYKDIVGEYMGNIELPKEEINNNTKDNIDDLIKEEKNNKIVNIPLIGKVNLKNLAIPLVTIIIGLLDGFNPCAMWVLLFLISMLLGMKDKKRMWSLGLAFIITSALIYFLFMVAWLNITSIITKVTLFRTIIAIIALIGGSINFYSYLKTRKETGCNVIDDKKRAKIFDKIKKFTHEKSFILALLGIISLAITVNLVELACSAGLPVMYIEILNMNNLSNLEYYLYIILYVIFFMLDDIIVFTVAMISLELTGFSTKYGKLSKLIGGILLIAIGILMLIKPEWLMFNFN